MRNAEIIKNEIEALEAKKDALNVKMTEYKGYNKMMNEGGEGYAPTRDLNWDIEDVEANICMLKLELENAEFAQEWTAEKTEERRAQWDAEEDALIAKGVELGSREMLQTLQDKFGFKESDLYRAVRLHQE